MIKTGQLGWCSNKKVAPLLVVLWISPKDYLEQRVAIICTKAWRTPLCPCTCVLWQQISICGRGAGCPCFTVLWGWITCCFVPNHFRSSEIVERGCMSLSASGRYFQVLRLHKHDTGAVWHISACQCLFTEVVIVKNANSRNIPHKLFWICIID